MTTKSTEIEGPKAPNTDTPVGRMNELMDDVGQEPWISDYTLGKLSLRQVALRDSEPEQALRENDFVQEIWSNSPEDLRRRFGKYYDSASRIAEVAAEDVRKLISDNQSPEIHSRFEDLKLMASDIFGNLHKLGLMPHFSEDYFLGQLANLKHHVYSKYDPVATPKEGSTTAAFFKLLETEIGFVGIENLTEIYYLHESGHAELEFHGDLNTVSLGEFCNSMREAIVQHIADRGLQFARSPYFFQEEVPVFSDKEIVSGFMKPEFTADDMPGIYEADRKIMYELCEGIISVKDFTNALTDRSGESFKELDRKLNKQFPELAARSLGVVLLYISNRIDGPAAKELTGGLENRHERAEFVLNEIRLIKGKRAEAQGSGARQRARLAYQNARRSR